MTSHLLAMLDCTRHTFQYQFQTLTIARLVIVEGDFPSLRPSCWGALVWYDPVSLW